jgi:hypothetical protein
MDDEWRFDVSSTHNGFAAKATSKVPAFDAS